MAGFKVGFHSDVVDYAVSFDDGEDHAVSFDEAEDYNVAFDDGEDHAVSFGTVYNISDGGFELGYEYGYKKGYDEGLSDADTAWYEGEYEVIPKVAAQKLETANKMMAKDLTIKEIPYFEVSNLAGGSTVTIGGN